MCISPIQATVNLIRIGGYLEKAGLLLCRPHIRSCDPFALLISRTYSHAAHRPALVFITGIFSEVDVT